MQYLIMILIFAKFLKTENKSGNVQYIQIKKIMKYFGVKRFIKFYW
jgi:hypothetical protein